MMAAAQIQTPRPRFISVGASRRAQQARRPFLAVRAVETATESTTTQAAEPSTSATYFFRGKAYNQAEVRVLEQCGRAGQQAGAECLAEGTWDVWLVGLQPPGVGGFAPGRTAGSGNPL